jgi:hypothetical protein
MTERLSASDPAVQAALGRTNGRRTISRVPLLVDQCRYARLEPPEAEYRFHPTRNWRFDLAFVKLRLAVEVDGGAFLKAGGRHTRGAGFRRDCEKLAEAAILGWTVLHVMPEHVTSRQAVSWIERWCLARMR